MLREQGNQQKLSQKFDYFVYQICVFKLHQIVDESAINLWNKFNEIYLGIPTKTLDTNMCL